MKMSDEQLKDIINQNAPLKKGDRVRILRDGGYSPLSGFTNGEIYTVTDPEHRWDDDKTKVQIVTRTNFEGYADRDQLEVVRDE